MNIYKLLSYGALLLALTIISSCQKYLNVVPDNIATVDYAFHTRDQAEKFFFTCYSYLPNYGGEGGNVGMLASDEMTAPYQMVNGFNNINIGIARGEQNIVDPIANFWDGQRQGKPYFEAIRSCNTFLDNIDDVPDISAGEKAMWIAEVRFLKAFYHFWLLRMYGAVPIMETSLPISSSIEEVKVYRDPVDSVFNYVVSLIDQAIPDLMETFDQAELGRVNRAVALAMKAKILVYSASPLFNGNSDYAGFTDNRGVHLFSQQYDPGKWEKAAAACKEAIEACERTGMFLHRYDNPRVDLSDSIRWSQSVVAAVTEKWNPEIIWGASNAWAAQQLQSLAMPRLSPYSSSREGSSSRGFLSVPLGVAEMFYSENGVPIEEDKNYDYANRLTQLKTPTATERYYMRSGRPSALLNFNREPRFYGSLGFNGGVWYGIGKYENDMSNAWYLEGKSGEFGGFLSIWYNITGYWPKKIVNINASIADAQYTVSYESYPWPIMRLADLYLLYAEALNEVQGPGPEVYKWLDLVRERSGLGGVATSWELYSRNPTKPATQDGLREIIQQERLIELCFEGHRFWDIRRWKQAIEKLNRPIRGWNYLGEDDGNYYKPYTVYQSEFRLRDYFWPISETALLRNTNLVQNPGW